MITHIGKHLAHFNRIILRFCASLELIHIMRHLIRVHVLRIRAVLNMNNRIHEPVFKHFRGKPTYHASRAAAGTPAISRHISHICIEPIAEILIMVYASLLREKLSTKNILINGAGERTRAVDCIFIRNRALYRSLIASINVLGNVECWVKICA